MPFDLRSKSGDELVVWSGMWPFVLKLAMAYGWQPRKTVAPKGVKAIDWGGGYGTSEGQTVVQDDAKNLANALERARRDPHASPVREQIAHQLAADVRAGFLQAAGQELDDPDLEHDFTCDTESLNKIVDFCRKGQFTIDG